MNYYMWFFKVYEPTKLINYIPMDYWDEKDAKKKISEIYQKNLEIIDENIKWYLLNIVHKRSWSQIIKVLSIVLLIISTIIPYISSINNNNAFLYWGYLLASIGAGLLLLDKYYGFSSSWVRYTITVNNLLKLRNNFVENWQILYLENIPLTLDSFRVLNSEIIKFQNLFYDSIALETNEWAAEFRENLKELNSALKSQSDSVKEKIDANSSLTQSNNRGDFADISKDIPKDIIDEAIDENFDNWKTKYNALGFSFGKKTKDKAVTDINSIVFLVDRKLQKDHSVFNSVPATIRYKAGDGKTYEIPTDIIESGGEIKASSKPALLCDDTVPKAPGCSISRKGHKFDTGTLGLIVYKENKPHILSCYHVLCSTELTKGELKFSESTSVNSVIVSPSEEDSNQPIELALIADGELNDQMDCAIASINDPLDITNSICQIGFPPGFPLTIDESHQEARYPVVSIGRTTGITKGTVLLASTQCDIIYTISGQSKKIRMKGVVCTTQITDGGDSGSAVLDENNDVIGLIIASSGNLSFIIPIQRILTRFTVSLTKIGI